jgi:hypothetical protein
MANTGQSVLQTPTTSRVFAISVNFLTCFYCNSSPNLGLPLLK